MSRPKKDIASRVFPALAFGTLKEVDEFIRPGVAAEGNRQAPRHERWWVDSTPFDNLTKAREFVINELQIPITDEIRTEFDYEPASGWKKKNQTKGTNMASPYAPQTVEQAQAKLQTAITYHNHLKAKPTEGMEESVLSAHNHSVHKAQKRIYAHQQAVKAAELGMSGAQYAKYKRTLPPAAKDEYLAAQAHMEGEERTMDHSPQILGPGHPAPEMGLTHERRPESHPRRSETREQELRRRSAEHSGFEVSITTAGGSNMSIKCVDDRALDSVFLMVKKHGI